MCCHQVDNARGNDPICRARRPVFGGDAPGRKAALPAVRRARHGERVGGAETGGRVEESLWAQRRISTNGRTQRLPCVLLIFTLVDLAWEIVKVNLGKQDHAVWPWRFTVLDASTCAAVVALLTGILVTRSQLSQTLQPVLSWSAWSGQSREVPDSLRTVALINAGGGRSVVRSVTYRLGVSPRYSGQATIPSGWISWRAAIEILVALELDWDHDFYLLHLGRGAAIPTTSNPREGMEILALGPKAFERLSVLDIRVQVTDVLGDVHERDLQCIRPPGHRPHNNRTQTTSIDVRSSAGPVTRSPLPPDRP